MQIGHSHPWGARHRGGTHTPRLVPALQRGGGAMRQHQPGLRRELCAAAAAAGGEEQSSAAPPPPPPRG